MPRTGESRHPDRAPASRSRDRRPGRDRYPFRAAQGDGRLHAVLQVHRPQRRAEAQQDRDLHAEAALRRQRLGNAYPHLALERWEAALCREWLRGLERHGALFHRRNSETRAGLDRDHQPDHEQLQASRPRIRGAGQSRLFGAKSIGRDPDPDLFGESRNRSESNSGHRTRPRIHMLPLRRSFSPVSMESRTGSIRAIRSTRISTNFRRKNWRMCRACPIR